MALAVGQKAPYFSLPATGGQQIDSKVDLSGKAFILYFYPKDFTKGCSAEACEFRDQFEAFRELDIPVFGVSRDDIPTHEKFKEANRLPFELLSDKDGKVCKSYDALIPLIGVPKRVTYLIDKDHGIAAVFSDMFESKKHVETMVKQLNP